MEENLGTCCACGESKGVRNIYCLEKKSPVPGQGWGCFKCGLSQDGAVVVVCDDCHDSNAPLKFACEGYPGKNKRVPIESLTGVHKHNLLKHADELAALN